MEKHGHRMPGRISRKWGAERDSTENKEVRFSKRSKTFQVLEFRYEYVSFSGSWAGAARLNVVAYIPGTSGEWLRDDTCAQRLLCMRGLEAAPA